MASTCGIALGTNVGNRLANLRRARDLLLELASADVPPRQSGIYQSDPVDCPPDSPDFYNAVLEIAYPGRPEELLEATQVIESRLGRQSSPVRNSPRPIDLDLLYVDDLVFKTPDLILPHPRLTDRRFVLKPLIDVRPDLILPGDDVTIAEHLRRLDTPEPDPLLVQTAW